MKKKIGIALISISLAFFVFAYLKIGKLEKQVQSWLAENHVVLNSAKFSFFPQPELTLENPQGKFQQYHFEAQKVRLKFDWFSWQGKWFPLKEINLNQGTFFSADAGSSAVQLNTANLILKGISLEDLTALSAFLQGNPPNSNTEYDVQFSAETLQSDHLTLATKFSLHTHGVVFSRFNADLQLHQKWQHMDNLNIAFGKGSLSFHKTQYDFVADSIHINQQYLGYGEGKIRRPSKTQENLTALFRFGQETLNLQFSPQQQLQLEGSQLEINRWLRVFQLPALLSGNADMMAKLKLNPIQGEFQLNMAQGQLNGIDTLDLVSRYLPLNVDNADLAQKENSTPFQSLRAEIVWSPEELSLRKLHFSSPHFQVQVQGDMNTVAQQCDLTANIMPTKSKYANLALPVRLFGDCAALQYKVQIDRTFRQQLKQFIKEKWK